MPPGQRTFVTGDREGEAADEARCRADVVADDLVAEALAHRKPFAGRGAWRPRARTGDEAGGARLLAKYAGSASSTTTLRRAQRRRESGAALSDSAGQEAFAPHERAPRPSPLALLVDHRVIVGLDAASLRPGGRPRRGAHADEARRRRRPGGGGRGQTPWARADARHRRSATAGGEADPATGRCYYVHEITAACQWERPDIPSYESDDGGGGDDEVNALVWKCLGYRRDGESYASDAVFPKWRQYPAPIWSAWTLPSKDVDEPVLRANQALVASIPMKYKGGIKEHLRAVGWTGYKLEGLTPTRRRACANWLYYREALFGLSLDELRGARPRRRRGEPLREAGKMPAPRRPEQESHAS
ncbi:DUF1823-containing protein [Aureococcus anophagefferens]|nr:DUF1823-containing protein [Aureococcus anophagefferens]